MAKRTTLNELFPGNMGGLRLATVILRTNRPELMRFPRDEELPPELAALVLQELARMGSKQ